MAEETLDHVEVSFQGFSAIDLAEAPSTDGFTIHPRSRLFRAWDSISVFLCYLTSILVTYQASFDSSVQTFMALGYMLDLIFLSDMVSRFYLAYYEKAKLITDRRLIRQEYLRGPFVWHLLSILPLDVLVLALQSEEMMWHQALSLLRLNRLLRLHRLVEYFGAREKDIRSSTTVIRSMKYSAMATLLIHFLACGWFVLACDNEGAKNPKCLKESWMSLQKVEGLALETIGSKYMTALYWATATATSTGYGDVYATNDKEKWFSVLAMLLGISMFFGLMLGGMASIVNNMDKMRAHYIQHLAAIKAYMDDANITEDVQERVLTYYEYMWSTSHGVSTADLFYDMPSVFQAELAIDINKHFFEKAHVFKEVSDACKRMIAMCIKPTFFMPSQMIVKKGETGQSICYIHKGKAEIYDDDDITQSIVLEEGYIFGEVSLVYNMLRASNVRALSPCVVFILNRDDMNKVLKHYPEDFAHLLHAVDHRCEIVERKRKSSLILDLNQAEANKWLIGKMGAKAVHLGDSWWERVKNRVISPHSRGFAIWEKIHISVLILVCFLYSFIASFSIVFHKLGYGESIGTNLLLAFSYLLDFVLVADFLLRFNLATAVTNDLKEIRANYIRTKLFWLDLVAILPIEVLAVFMPAKHLQWHALSFLKLNRLLKIGRLISYFNDLENRFGANVGNVRSIKFGFYILISTHICACLWFVESCYGKGCKHGSWATDVIQVSDPVGLSEYIASMYWAAASMSSTGYGDIHAHDNASEMLSIIVMLTGMLLYGYFMCSFSATIAHTFAPKTKFYERILSLREFLAKHNIANSLIQRTEDYLTTLWEIGRGESIPGSKRLMDDMPLVLQQDVCEQESTDILREVPLFIECDENFIKQLSLCTTSYIFKPGDYIVYAGDMGREMYCIRRGQVNILNDEDEVVGTLGPGSFFGEIGLVCGESRVYTVQCKTYCQTLMLTKHDMDKVLGDFPLLRREINESGDRHVGSKILEQSKPTPSKLTHRQSLVASYQGQRSRDAYRRRLMDVQSSKKIMTIAEEDVDGDDTKSTGGDFVADTFDTEEEFKRPYRKLHIIPRIFAYLLMRKGISPDQLWLQLWQGVTTTIAGVYVSTLGLQAAILHVDTTFWVLHYVFELVFLVDIYIKFHVGYYNENKVLVTHPIFTARRYLRTNFLLDVLCCFPTEIFVLAVLPIDKAIMRVLAFARLNRCLHFYRLVQFFSYMEEPLGSRANFYRQLKFVIYMSIFTHYMACGWFILACDGQIDGSHICREGFWAMSSSHSLKKGDPVFKKYLLSFYWAAATCASVGYGDIRSYQVSEMAYSFVFMIFGIVFYGYIVASVAAGLANADAQRARFQERLTTIGHFLDEEKVPKDVAERITRHYAYMWERNRGVDESSLFQGIPLAMHADITSSLYHEVIEKVPLFKGKEHGFLKLLSMYMRPIYFLAKEYIVRQGEIGHEMYFIQKGDVEVLDRDGNALAVLGPGSFFGEVSVLFNTPRTTSIRTRTNCDVYLLMKEDMTGVLSHYPEIKEEMIRIAEENELRIQERVAEIDKNEPAAEAVGDDDVIVDVEVEEQGPSPPNFCTSILNFLWKKLSEFVIEPESKLHFIRFLNCALIFLTSITITFCVAFQEHGIYFFFFQYFCELSFYVEIFFRFNMAYRLPTGELETDQRRIAIHYVKSGFVFDLVASFPFEIFALAAPGRNMLEVMSYLRLTHLLRIRRLSQFFEEYGYKLNINVFYVRMTKFVLYVILTVHMFACGWYFMDCPGNWCDPKERYWLDDHGLRGKAGLTIYISCLYWVVTSVTTTGYGDIHADNNNEMMYATFVMIGGKLLFGFILGNIASTLSNLEMKQIAYVQKLQSITSYLTKENTCQVLRDRVLNFYEFLWMKHKGTDLNNLFFDLPLCLHGDLSMVLVGDILKKVPVFRECSDAFIRLLSVKARPKNYRATDYILHKGDIGQQLIIIKRGTAEVITGEDPEVILPLEEMSFYGDRYLLAPGPHLETLRAVTNVDVFILERSDLDEILLFDKATEQRVREAGERCLLERKESEKNL
ncbi:uncharacterized protein LOC5507177 [Nematostella vectensis]|uniref:uncharacterized protein LOC5507177 n=1 Tax=Nematostella vectensis TaxID=45351 RepID=UPI002077013D|nr:uncharacterized protein LOC5507177 [Nematostella vectensis]